MGNDNERATSKARPPKVELTIGGVVHVWTVGEALIVADELQHAIVEATRDLPPGHVPAGYIKHCGYEECCGPEQPRVMCDASCGRLAFRSHRGEDESTCGARACIEKVQALVLGPGSAQAQDHQRSFDAGYLAAIESGDCCGRGTSAARPEDYNCGWEAGTSAGHAERVELLAGLTTWRAVAQSFRDATAHEAQGEYDEALETAQDTYNAAARGETVTLNKRIDVTEAREALARLHTLARGRGSNIAANRDWETLDNLLDEVAAPCASPTKDDERSQDTPGSPGACASDRAATPVVDLPASAQNSPRAEALESPGAIPMPFVSGCPHTPQCRGLASVCCDKADPPRTSEDRPRRECLCEGCHREYPVWVTTNALWNEFVRAFDQPEPFLCPTCFAERAEERGAKPTAWVLVPETPEMLDMLTGRRSEAARPTIAEQALTTLAHHGGALVSSAACSVAELAWARMEDRFFVTQDRLGYVRRPAAWLARQERPGLGLVEAGRRSEATSPSCSSCHVRVPDVCLGCIVDVQQAHRASAEASSLREWNDARRRERAKTTCGATNEYTPHGGPRVYMTCALPPDHPDEMHRTLGGGVWKRASGPKARLDLIEETAWALIDDPGSTSKQDDLRAALSVSAAK